MTVRDLDTITLANAARDYSAAFLRPTVMNPHNAAFAPIDGRGWMLNSMEHFHFEDEFKFLMDEMRGYLGPKALKEFQDAASKAFTPYDDGELAHELAERLAISPDGKRLPGRLGKVKQGTVIIGFRFKTHVWVTDRATGKKVKVKAERPIPRWVRADIQVGETEEEAVFRVTKLHQDHGEVIFPVSQFPVSMALNPRISNEAAIFACDAIVDRLDEGSGAGLIQGRSGAQPADPDTAVSGTLLFTLIYSDPAFGNAVDANPGGRATASAITNDSSADATATLGYCRASATNDGATPLDDHIDGEAGTSGADYNFNTVSIVSGATISLTSQTVTVPES